MPTHRFDALFEPLPEGGRQVVFPSFPALSLSAAAISPKSRSEVNTIRSSDTITETGTRIPRMQARPPNIVTSPVCK